MTLLLLTLLAAEPASPVPPASEKTEAPKLDLRGDAPRAQTPAGRPTEAPPIPPPEVPDEIAKGSDESVGYMLLRTIVVLGMVVMLAYVSLNWGLRRMLGLKVPALGSSVVSVIERVPLDQRRSVFLIKAGSEYLLVGGSEASLSLLSKLDTQE